MTKFPLRVSAGALLLFAASESAHAQQACADLINLDMPYTTITNAAIVPEGPIPVPALFGKAPPVNAPEHCEVQAVIRPTTDSEIKMELWLPVAGWNEKAFSKQDSK